MYMAKLLGNKLVAEIKMPVLVARKKRKRLPQTPPVCLATKLHNTFWLESSTRQEGKTETVSNVGDEIGRC